MEDGYSAQSKNSSLFYLSNLSRYIRVYIQQCSKLYNKVSLKQININTSATLSSFVEV